MLLCGLGATAQKYTLKVNNSKFRNLDLDYVMEFMDYMYEIRDTVEAHFIIYHVPRIFRKGWILYVNVQPDGMYEFVDYYHDNKYFKKDLHFVKTILEGFEEEIKK